MKNHGSILSVDFNHNLFVFAEIGSATLPPERQGEISHRYMLGLYEILEKVMSRYWYAIRLLQKWTKCVRQFWLICCWDVKIILPCKASHRAAAERLHVEAVLCDNVYALSKRARLVLDRENKYEFLLACGLLGGS